MKSWRINKLTGQISEWDLCTVCYKEMHQVSHDIENEKKYYCPTCDDNYIEKRYVSKYGELADGTKVKLTFDWELKI